MVDRKEDMMRLSRTIVVAIVAGLAVICLFDPSSVGFYPRCPFFVLTGLKCPGCGTLRALHCIMHGHFGEAWQLNPALLISVPIIAALFLFPRYIHSPVVGWGILIATVAWWIGRNVF